MTGDECPMCHHIGSHDEQGRCHARPGTGMELSFCGCGREQEEFEAEAMEWWRNQQ